MIPEAELLNNIKNDSKNFGQLFHLYYKDIFGYIFRRTTSFETTQDIASETFYKAYLHIKHFDYRGISLKIWLYRIATNEVNSYFRHRKKYSFQISALRDDNIYNAYIQEDRSALERELEKHQSFLYVLQIVKEMPVKYQDVISLRYFEEKSIREISQILNRKEGTVKSLLSRAIEKLRVETARLNPFND